MARSALLNVMTQAAFRAGRSLSRDFGEVVNLQVSRKGPEDFVAKATPLGAEQTPEDIGNLAVFYASDKARMITGAVVAVDGGCSI